MIAHYAAMIGASLILGNLIALIADQCGAPFWLRLCGVILMGIVIGMNPPIKR